MSFTARRLATAALTANAIRPLPGKYAVIPAFFGGWLAGELAPQLLLLTLADTAQAVRRHRARPRDLALSVASAAGLAYLISGAQRVGTQVESNIRDGIGPDYQDLLTEPPTPRELATQLRDVARPFAFTKPGVEVIRNLNYTEGGKRARLDIYRPQGVEVRDAPVLLQIHGGGWTIGTKEQQGLLLMNRMAQAGWVCVAINYRLAPKHPFPAQIIDVKKALAWTKANIASYGGDPSYVVVTGGSAGGHLAALAALTPGDRDYQPGFEDADTSVAGCVPFYGVYDLAGHLGDKYSVGMRDSFLAPTVFKQDPRVDIAPFEKASPLLRITPDAPDFFVLHGTHDSLVNISQARAFVKRLREVSRRSVTYAELPGAQHAFEVFGSIRSQHVIKAVARWLQWHRATWQAERSAAGQS